MLKSIVPTALAGLLCALSIAPAGATDLETTKPRHKRHNHHYGSKRPPGPVLAVQIVRPPTCNVAWPLHYPNYKQASCRDYEGFATVYDPRSPDGLATYGFRALYGLR